MTKGCFTDVRLNESKARRSRLQQIPELIVFSEDSFTLFLDKIDMAVEEADLNAEHPGFLKWLAYELQQEFNRTRHTPVFRAALTAYGELELKKKLLHLKKMVVARPDVPFSYPSAGLYYGIGSDDGKMAYLFPGQGSQYLGMGKALAATFSEAGRVFDRLGKQRFSGHTIEEIISQPDHGDRINARAAFLRLCGSEWANACISVVGEAIFALLKRMGALPHAVASHSFGDVSAFRAAQILSDDAMLQLHHFRGKLGESCPLATKGCILVVRETAEKINKMLRNRRIGDVWIANYNTDSQTVISGLREEIQVCRSAFKKEKIVCQLIPISAAPHCPLAVDVATKFDTYMQKHIDFDYADCDVYSYLFGRKVKNDPTLFHRILRIHIEKPVRFKSQIENMYEDGIRIFVEVGPSDVLTRFVEQILDGRLYAAVHTDSKKGDAVLTFLQAVAELFKAGRIMNLDVLWENYEVPQHPCHGIRQPNGFIPEDLQRLQKLDLKLARIENLRSMQP